MNTNEKAMMKDIVERVACEMIQGFASNNILVQSNIHPHIANKLCESNDITLLKSEFFMDTVQDISSDIYEFISNYEYGEEDNTNKDSNNEEIHNIEDPFKYTEAILENINETKVPAGKTCKIDICSNAISDKVKKAIKTSYPSLNVDIPANRVTRWVNEIFITTTEDSHFTSADLIYLRGIIKSLKDISAEEMRLKFNPNPKDRSTDKYTHLLEDKERSEELFGEKVITEESARNMKLSDTLGSGDKYYLCLIPSSSIDKVSLDKDIKEINSTISFSYSNLRVIASKVMKSDIGLNKDYSLLWSDGFYALFIVSTNSNNPPSMHDVVKSSQFIRRYFIKKIENKDESSIRDKVFTFGDKVFYMESRRQKE